MIKKILLIFALFGLVLFLSTRVMHAHSTQPGDPPVETQHVNWDRLEHMLKWHVWHYVHNHPNYEIVAFYTQGYHGIPGEPGTHYGFDMVAKVRDTYNFDQWFYGWGEGEGLHGERSVWMVMEDPGCTCDHGNGWMIYEDPYPEWGDYLKPDTDYCVKTKGFHLDYDTGEPIWED